ncbi:MAG: DNA polymerase III subunit gamma/tau [Flavobacteriales bacterium]|nr:DNA polymerase III subunit gamma/tau [Flavobacteriales bacterium]|tara:strand:+ start:3054 stop:4178 length:1125 start_codon:yes stop_codon:yes gene_type:complete
MDNFVVSARKYRPDSFNTVVGQTSIISTLKNSILSKQVAQAFLFCGPRGVGKTTCARILAKTINCSKITSSGESCSNCESCKSFDQGNSLNIFELDAASNNSVDDIRNLINQVRIAPTIGTKKAYIIDEVHMLSSSAFNAFLKTLEEPPKHAVFILATTEKHKILPTILSRCQIFNFNRITSEDIAKHLSEIAIKENVNADPDALHIIGQKADGGLRDALSIFDQLISFSGGELTYENVIHNLNILDYDYYFKTTDLIKQQNLSGLLLLLNQILEKGFEDLLFMNGLASHFRDLLVSKDESTLVLLDVGDKIKDRYAVQSRENSISFLINALEILSNYDVQFKTSKNKRLLTEITLMQLCSEELFENKKKSLVK